MADFREQINYEIVDDYHNIYVDPLIYGMSKFTDLFPLASLQRYIVQGNDSATWWSLSNKFYGTIDYWWLLGFINGVDNILVPLQNQSTLYVPSITQINQYRSALSQMSTGINSNINPNYIGGTYTM